MNAIDYDILLAIINHPGISQRELATRFSCSLGKINTRMKRLKQAGYLTSDHKPSALAEQELNDHRPSRGIILAAGFGLRMIPLNMDTPKGLIKVRDETLIERLIRQLKEAGIEEIHIVVGHLKEAYEFLIDIYGVHLITNPDYASTNNLHSLYAASPYLKNAYILPCDVWLKENPFSSQEFYSWYLVSDGVDPEGALWMNRNRTLGSPPKNTPAHPMIGIAYITKKDHPRFLARLQEMVRDPHHAQSFWEDALFDPPSVKIEGKFCDHNNVYEFNSISDLHRLKEASQMPDHPTLRLIADILQVSPSDLQAIRPLKQGMTNRSFVFRCHRDEYIMRIPGEGTDQLINRRQEAEVHQILAKASLSGELLYIDPKTGYKLTKKLPHARVCDVSNPQDVKRCMTLLRQFHERKLSVDHHFDLFERIEFYESLRKGHPSVYRDYAETKEKVFTLKPFISSHVESSVLCHIDAVCDNFLFYREKEVGEELLTMIDWEYAGMQDPHVDIAMFAVYSNFTQPQLDQLIHFYFEGNQTQEQTVKIYAYISVIGLLWSNWCEFKRLQGIDFGEYSLYQYRFAKEYYRKVTGHPCYRQWNTREQEKQ